MDNQKKLATFVTLDTRRKHIKQKTQPNICWVSPWAGQHN